MVFHPLPSGVRSLAFGLVASLLLILVRPYLPQRHLDLLASAPGRKPLLMNEEVGHPAGDTKMVWVDRARHHFRCETDALRALPLCGMFLDLNDRAVGRGLDLSGYQSIDIGIRYQGTGEHVRVAMASFIPGRSDVKDHRTWPPQAGYVAVNQAAGQEPVTLSLSALSVPEWWLMSPQGAKLSGSSLDLSNCVTLTVDVPYRGGRDWYDIEVTKLGLRGELIPAGRLYLLILCAWLLAAAWVIARRLAIARQRRRDHLHVISTLVLRERDLRAEQAELKRKVTVDPLTLALNRVGMETALQSHGEWAGERSLFMVDVDHFKRINDRWGHDVGDVVLRQVAAELKHSLRADDLVCRWGGEEFVVCASCSPADRALVAEKIRQRIGECRIRAPGVPEELSVTVSIGATALRGAADFEAALRRADIVMYQAKRQGRNQVVMDQGDHCDDTGCDAAPAARAANAR